MTITCISTVRDLCMLARDIHIVSCTQYLCEYHKQIALHLISRAQRASRWSWQQTDDSLLTQNDIDLAAL